MIIFKILMIYFYILTCLLVNNIPHMFQSIVKASLILGKIVTSRKDEVIKVKLTENEKKVVHANFTEYCEAVRTMYEGWRIFPHYDHILEKDFPEAEQEYDYVLIPGYELSIKIPALLRNLAKKLFPNDVDNAIGGFWDILEDEQYVARITLTVRELLEPLLDMEEISEEAFATLNDDLLNQIIE